MTTKTPVTADALNKFAGGYLPALLGIEVSHVGVGEVACEMRVNRAVLAPNGYLHAGSVVSLADTAAGYGCLANLPEGAHSFTTIELKSNHIGTAREGVVICLARLEHGGRSTQVWDATVVHRDTGKTIALFRCTQMLLHSQAA